MPWLRSLAALLLCSAVATAGDWPQWLGPHRDGSSPEKVAAWKQAPKVLWRKAVGAGHSSPVVADGKVFVHALVKGKDQEEVVAFDAKTGNELWRTAYDRGEFTSIFGNGPRATPTVVGGHIYTFGVTGILSCFQTGKGEKVWQVDTLKKFKAKNLTFGVSCSPLVEGDKVLVNVGGKGASIVAFGKDKGDVVWKALDDPASYSSPIAFGQGKERQIVFLTAANLAGLSPADGSAFWKFPLVDKLAESSTTPVKVGDVLLGSSVTYGSVGLKLEHQGRQTDGGGSLEERRPDLLFLHAGCRRQGARLHGDRQHHSRRRRPPFAASRSRAARSCGASRRSASIMRRCFAPGNDKLLLLDDSGNLVLLEPSPKEYKELARSKVAGETWAHPALSDGRLYVRDAKELICLQIGE